MRTGEWRYIRYNDDEELYDREEDRNQRTDVAAWLPRHNKPDAPRLAVSERPEASR